MIDTVDIQHIKRFPYIGGRPLFARMRHQQEPARASTLEHAREFRRRMADLR
jgi:hypothetical protein